MLDGIDASLLITGGLGWTKSTLTTTSLETVVPSLQVKPLNGVTTIVKVFVS